MVAQRNDRVYAGLFQALLFASLSLLLCALTPSAASSRQQVDGTTAEVAQLLAYDPNGRPLLLGSGAVGPRYTFNLSEAVAGAYDAGARLFSTSGNFLSSDPVIHEKETGSFNTFVALGGDPINTWDWDGLDETGSPAQPPPAPGYVHAKTCVGDGCKDILTLKKKLELKGSVNKGEAPVIKAKVIEGSEQVASKDVPPEEIIPGYGARKGGEKYGYFRAKGSGDNVLIETVNHGDKVVAACMQLEGCAPGVIEQSKGFLGGLAKVAQGAAGLVGGDLSCKASAMEMCFYPGQPESKISARTPTGAVAETDRAVKDFDNMLVPGKEYNVNLRPGSGFVIIEHADGTRKLYTNVKAAPIDFGPNSTIPFRVLEQ